MHWFPSSYLHKRKELLKINGVCGAQSCIASVQGDSDPHHDGCYTWKPM